MSTLYTTQAVLDSIRSHGEETYPFECCGALIGESLSGAWRVIAALRAVNTRIDSAHNRYRIDPLDLVRIDREARRLGFDIAGFYHSHPDHPAQWSKTDLENAHWLGCSYVITEVAKGKAGATNSFLLAGDSEEEKQFLQQRIILEGRSQ